MLYCIWAQDSQGTIGKDGQLPWSLPNDLKYFKETTLNHTVVMGRVTFEGMGRRCLPKRRNFVMTRDTSYHAQPAEAIHSVEEVLALAKTEDIFIIGGAAIYAQFFPYADKLFITKIHHQFEGDTTIPRFNEADFILETTIAGVCDEKNRYPHTFEVYVRKR